VQNYKYKCSGNLRLGYFYLNPKAWSRNNRSSFPRISPSHFLTAQLDAPLTVGLLEQAKVISRCPTSIYIPFFLRCKAAHRSIKNTCFYPSINSTFTFSLFTIFYFRSQIEAYNSSLIHPFIQLVSIWQDPILGLSTF